MFKIKICGVTTPDDAGAVARAGADAIGLNFYGASPRYIEPEAARGVAHQLPDRIVKVGLFVNASARTVLQTFEQADLDLVQLHGDEPPAFLAELGDLPVMKAFRLGDQGLAPVLAYLDACRSLDAAPKLVLIDSFAKGSYGGTGNTADWGAASSYPRGEGFPPLVLAGGLKPSNVAAAIRQVRPMAVDTASGVELSPPRKDPALVREFVQAASRAFGEA